jgi:HEAT repeat protein
VEADRLSRQVTQAGPVDRGILLNRLRDGTSAACTPALGRAAAALDGGWREKAREALAQRLAKATAPDLRAALTDPDTEVRTAAAQAAGRRTGQAFVPELIALLDDPEPVTADAAQEALRAATGQELSDSGEWKGWWRHQGRE